jgi:hypothetical protein
MDLARIMDRLAEEEWERADRASKREAAAGTARIGERCPDCGCGVMEADGAGIECPDCGLRAGRDGGFRMEGKEAVTA